VVDITPSSFLVLYFGSNTTLDKIYCFGMNSKGQLGNGTWGTNWFGEQLVSIDQLVGTSHDQLNPQEISFLKNEKIIDIACGNEHTIILTEKKLYACGSNNKGQLGLGHNRDQSSPQEIVSFKNEKVKQIECGGFHTFVLTEKYLYGFGENDFGQLGIGNKENQNLPKRIMNFKVEKERIITSRGFHSFMLQKNEEMK
jgi:alpha-tubulin suppressor-like RCC1 family protein